MSWLWIIFWVAILCGTSIYAQLQKIVSDNITSTANDLTFGDQVTLHSNDLYVSSSELSNNSGAIFKMNGLAKESVVYGVIGQNLGVNLFSDGYTLTAISTGTLMKNNRETNGLVTLSGSYVGELTGFPSTPQYAITIMDQTLVSLGTKIYVYHHITRTSSYLAYIIDQVCTFMDGFKNRVILSDGTTCTILDRNLVTNTWEKTMTFESVATQLMVDGDVVYGTKDGKLYYYTLNVSNGTAVETFVDTAIRGYSRICADQSRNNFFIAVDDGTQVRVFRYSETDKTFDASATCTDTGLLDFAVTARGVVYISANHELYSPILQPTTARFTSASQLTNVKTVI